MAIYNDFVEDFPRRTLAIIKQYDEYVPKGKDNETNYELTLLLNCLLGLLVVFDQHWKDQIPAISIHDLGDWGIIPFYIKSWGKMKKGHNKDLKELVHRLRNGVAHLRILVSGDITDIADLQFTDENGFRAVIPIKSLRGFVEKLTQLVPSDDAGG